VPRVSPGLFPDELFFCSCSDHGTSGNGQKTYGSVFGMIFFGEVESLLVIERQRLATVETPKNRKNAKKGAK
jgi:hypothetical protein